MGNFDENSGSLSDEDQWLLAGAYQADRARNSALKLATWTVAYMKSRGKGTATKMAAHEFAKAAIDLAGVVIWNEAEFTHDGMCGSLARVAKALANDLVLGMEEVYMHGVNLALDEQRSVEEACQLALKHATKKTAETCVEICRLMPKMFDGPDGASQRKRARLEWRKIHDVAGAPQ